jgi:hypothetical protein
LGAGVLSVAPSNAADNTAISQGGTANATAAADILNIATVNNISASAGTWSAGSPDTIAGAASNGLLSRTATPGLTGTATLLSTGALTVYAAETASANGVIIVSGATITSAATTSGVIAYNSTATGIASAQEKGISAVIKPNAGVSSFTVSYYTGASASTTAPGTLKTQYIVTVAASSAAGTYSAAKSAVSLSGSRQSTTLTTGDVAGADTQATGGTAYVNFSLADAYGSALAADALVATASKGSYVAIGAAGSSINAGTAATAVDGASVPTNLAVRVDHATSGTPVTETVTLTYAGTVVATKTIKFQGHAAAIKISSVKTQALSATTSSSNVTFKADLADSAGNVLLATGRESFWSVDSGANLTVAGAVIKAAAAVDGSGVYSSATGTHSCASTAGSASIVLKYINVDGSVVKSSPVTLSCAGAAATYTAAMDKASYVTGEIATLTVSFKDSKGNAANDFDAIPASSGNRYVEASLPQTTIVGTAPAATQTPAGGVLTLKYSIGTSSGISAGTWTGTVNVASLNSVDTPQATQTVTYKVGTGDTGVTNADVLKAIVSLIASINKQIAALQKALLRR